MNDPTPIKTLKLEIETLKQTILATKQMTITEFESKLQTKFRTDLYGEAHVKKQFLPCLSHLFTSLRNLAITRKGEYITPPEITNIRRRNSITMSVGYLTPPEIINNYIAKIHNNKPLEGAIYAIVFYLNNCPKHVKSQPINTLKPRFGANLDILCDYIRFYHP